MERIEPNSKSSTITIGFIAKDFVSKGGKYLLEAYKKTRETHKNIKLIIIGCSSTISIKEQEIYDIQWIDNVPRAELMEQFFPKFDIFAYPTLADGLPLVIIEALSFGIPVLTSNLLAMPEMVGYGIAGEVTKKENVKSIVEKLSLMLKEGYLEQKRNDVRKHFQKTYDIKITTEKLGELYKECLIK